MTTSIKKLFFLFSLFISFNLYAEKALLIGIFKNAPQNDRIALQVSHHFIDGQSKTYRELIKDGGQFTLEVDIIEPQYVNLNYHGQTMVLYMEPADTLIVETDRLQFPMVAKFGGKGGHNNTLLWDFLKKNPINFNEFSRNRYKIHNHWCTIDADMDRRMHHTKAVDFKKELDMKQANQLALIDQYVLNNPSKVSPEFVNFITSEIMYTRAYRLLFYGNIYKVMHDIDPAFFEVLYDVSAHSETIGSPAYRRYIMAYFAHRSKQEQAVDDFSYQYLLASDILHGKSLAFFRSEIIYNALKEERYVDALPFYISFLENNDEEHFEEKVTELYQKALKISPGTLAPPFSGETAKGTTVSLAQMRGKVVYLNFWASYCGSCIKKMRYFNSLHTELEQAGVQIINVSLDKDLDTWRSHIESYGMKGLHLQTIHNTNTDIAKSYNVEAVPQYFLIGKDGTFESKPVSSKPEDIKNHLLDLTQ